MRNLSRSLPFAALCMSLSLAACSESEGDGDDHGDHDDHDDDDGHHESEVISRITLTFTPDDGSADIVASFDDPDGDGGMSGTSEPITLTSGVTYTMTVQFLNAIEDPAEDITEEVREEAEEHLVLVYGDAVAGPASTGNAALVTHDYDDVESDYGPNMEGEDLPVGLVNVIEATTAGSDGQFKVMLRHLPEQNGSPQKTGDLAETFAMGGAVLGEVDVDVTFSLTVQ